MKKFIFCCVMLCFCFMLSACKTKQNDIDVFSKNLTYYELDLAFDNQTKAVDAVEDIKYINNSCEVLKQLKFHLYPRFFEQDKETYVVPITKMNEAYPNGTSYASFNVNRVQVENKDVDIVYEGDCDSILVVDLNSNLLPGDIVNFKIEFNFVLPNCQHRFGYTDNTINIANFYPIACVYENGEFIKEPYNSNGDPFYSDMANYKVKLKCDKSLVVAGTGNKITTEQGYEFEARLVRDFALVLSENFATISKSCGDINVEYYYFSDTNCQNSLNVGIDALKTFAKLFGNYPYNNFYIVQTDFVYGGMEYPNLIMVSAQIEDYTDYCNVIVHETAHQWWYGMVGNDEFNEPWLDEAITEFSTILFYDYNEGYELNHNAIVKAERENYSTFITVYNEVLGDIDTSMRPINEYNTEPEYVYCIYVKGILMCESLYQLIGEKNFVSGLKIYFLNNKYKNANKEDLIVAFEESSKQNLHNFFDSWLTNKVVIK